MKHVRRLNLSEVAEILARACAEEEGLPMATRYRVSLALLQDEDDDTIGIEVELEEMRGVKN